MQHWLHSPLYSTAGYVITGPIAWITTYMDAYFLHGRNELLGKCSDTAPLLYVVCIQLAGLLSQQPAAGCTNHALKLAWCLLDIFSGFIILEQNEQLSGSLPSCMMYCSGIP